MGIKWILFDLDDTLIPSSEIYLSAYNQMNLDSDPEFLKAKAIVKSNLPKGHTSCHSRFLYFKKYIELKKEFSSKLLLDLNDRYENLIKQEIELFFKKTKRVKILDELSDNYKLGIVTNEVCRMQIIKLKSMDPRGIYFKFMMTSEEIGTEKPSKKIFTEALNRTSCQPSQVCFIGDSFSNDYIPAKKMGMRSFLSTEFLSEREIKKNINKKIPESSIITKFHEIAYKIEKK